MRTTIVDATWRKAPVVVLGTGIDTLATGGVVEVVAGARTWAGGPGESVSFGRTARSTIEIGLDPTDAGISRHAGRVRVDGDGVTIENHSTKRPLLVEYPAVVCWQRIEPSARYLLAGDALVLVVGTVYTHPLRIRVPTALRGPAAGPIDGAHTEPTTIDGGSLYSDDDRRALVALAWTYLQRWPRHDENPLTYAEAAARAGLEPAAFRRRLDRLRERLAACGLAEVSGDQARRQLVQWAIDTSVIGVADVDPPTPEHPLPRT